MFDYGALLAPEHAQWVPTCEGERNWRLIGEYEEYEFSVKKYKSTVQNNITLSGEKKKSFFYGLQWGNSLFGIRGLITCNTSTTAVCEL